MNLIIHSKDYKCEVMYMKSGDSKMKTNINILSPKLNLINIENLDMNFPGIFRRTRTWQNDISIYLMSNPIKLPTYQEESFVRELKALLENVYSKNIDFIKDQDTASFSIMLPDNKERKVLVVKLILDKDFECIINEFEAVSSVGYLLNDEMIFEFEERSDDLIITNIDVEICCKVNYKSFDDLFPIMIDLRNDIKDIFLNHTQFKSLFLIKNLETKNRKEIEIFAKQNDLEITGDNILIVRDVHHIDMKTIKGILQEVDRL